MSFFGLVVTNILIKMCKFDLQCTIEKKKIQHYKAMLNKVNIYFSVAYLKKYDAYA